MNLYPTIPALSGGKGGETEAALAATFSVSTFIFLFHRNKTEEDVSLPQLSLSSLSLSSSFSLDYAFSLSLWPCLSRFVPSLLLLPFLSHTSYQSPPLHPPLLSALVTSVNLISLIQDQCIPLSHLWVLWMYCIKSLGSHCATAYVEHDCLGAQQQIQHQLAALVSKSV